MTDQSPVTPERKPPLILTLTGPSCAGKTTLESMLKERGFVAAVSTTTRLPRPWEHEGQAYYFVTETRFEEIPMVESVWFNGNRYGVSTAEIERVTADGAPVVLVVEPNGRDQIREFCRKKGWKHIAVYVGNPVHVIAERFLQRVVQSTAPGSAPAPAHAQRLATMMTTERRWDAEAEYQAAKFKIGDPYDIMFSEFGPHNDAMIAEVLTVEAMSYRNR